MRMWKVDAKLLCRKHLLGEHVEMHMFAGSMRRGRKIDGHVRLGQVETHYIEKRHAQLAAEMERRGYRHQSELPEVKTKKAGRVDIASNLKELARRCPECRRRQRAGMREYK